MKSHFGTFLRNSTIAFAFNDEFFKSGTIKLELFKHTISCNWQVSKKYRRKEIRAWAPSISTKDQERALDSQKKAQSFS